MRWYHKSVPDESEAHSKSLLVTSNYECDMITATRNDKRSKSLNLPQRSRISSQEPKSSNDQCLFLPLPPPLFVTKTTSSLSGPQASTVQCSQGECVRPATNVISRLQDNLHPALGNITGTVEQQVTSIPSQSPRLQGADSKSSCASSPAVRRIKLVDRQFSNCSNKTLTGTSSPRSSTSSSSELYFTPQSSPLLIPHKGHHVPSKPITCTEASLNEHKPLNNEWQIHSSTLSQRSETYDHHGQGVNCFLASEGTVIVIIHQTPSTFYYKSSYVSTLLKSSKRHKNVYNSLIYYSIIGIHVPTMSCNY